MIRASVALVILGVMLMAGCKTAAPPAQVRPGDPLERRGDEIVAAGQFFHTGAPVVLWTDPGGYDAYRVERKFVPLAEASWRATQEEGRIRNPNRYGMRRHNLSEEQLERIHREGWDLATLQQVVDQFVIHYDVAGTAEHCFRILHDMRGLSVHFMLDLDGTIYQTLDLKESAWHATTSNSRSIGIEIANMGAYGDSERSPLDQWYTRDPDGRTRITIPARFGNGGIRTPNFVGRPIRDEPVAGQVQGRTLTQYDLTPEQYDSLIKLTAALVQIFPLIELDYPRDEQGNLITRTLPDEQLAAYRGLIGHYHIQTNKVDPGPAFQWDRVIEGARALIDARPRFARGPRAGE